MPLEHWLVRGAQSAIFYYLSCGPCYTASYMRKRKREAVRDRKLKEALALEHPDLYTHPAPFEINPYWQEEITIGPGPPPRRNRNRTRDSSSTNPSSQPQQSSLNAMARIGTHGSTTSSTSELGPLREPKEAHLAGGLNTRERYNRPDEEYLWEEKEEAVEPDSPSNYHTTKAPPVNDLHPPIVSVLSSKEDNRRWMKQPPPSTLFMNGKKGATNIKRSGSEKSEGLSRRGSGKRALDSRSSRGASPESKPSHVDALKRLSALTASTERVGTPKSRPDSAVSSTSNQRRNFRYRPLDAPYHSTESSSDGDAEIEDEYKAETSTVLAKPSPKQQRSDDASLQGKFLRSRHLFRPPLAAIPSQDASNSPASLRPRSEAFSPRDSPRSTASHINSQLSLSDSENDGPKSFASSQGKSRSRKAKKAIPTLSGIKASQDRGSAISSRHRAELKRSITDEGDAQNKVVDSAVMLTEMSADVVVNRDDDKAARERMWLGAQKVVDEYHRRLSKRWSTEF